MVGKKIFELQVTQRRVVISDAELLAEATARWECSMNILFELQDKYEAGLELELIHSNVEDKSNG